MVMVEYFCIIELFLMECFVVAIPYGSEWAEKSTHLIDTPC
uniref:Uncharacterized protein n=1 Tax=Rhizophora mucronata TaxID=61149 RepID=A0A2P2NHA3_RHIMU